MQAELAHNQEEHLRFPIIEVSKLSRIYSSGVRGVENVSFTVFQDEIFGFLGPNGAGKTTTINILTTQTRPSSGSARIAGWDVARDPGFVRWRPACLRTTWSFFGEGYHNSCFEECDRFQHPVLLQGHALPPERCSPRQRHRSSQIRAVSS